MLGKYVIQGQILAKFNKFEFKLLFPHDWLIYRSTLLFTHRSRENIWIHAFPKGINAMWKCIEPRYIYIIEKLHKPSFDYYEFISAGKEESASLDHHRTIERKKISMDSYSFLKFFFVNELESIKKYHFFLSIVW